jgi:hypothetical protein
MLTNPQKSLLKTAQRWANLPDPEYRDAIELVGGPGVRSSTDPKLDNRHLDKLMAYLEAIYWHKVDAGTIQQSFSAKNPLRNRGFWADRNTKGSTTRDRYNTAELAAEIMDLEGQLLQLGNHPNYLDAIRTKVMNGRHDGQALWHYKSALQRTLSAKQRSSRGKEAVSQPY